MALAQHLPRVRQVARQLGQRILRAPGLVQGGGAVELDDHGVRMRRPQHAHPRIGHLLLQRDGAREVAGTGVDGGQVEQAAQCLRMVGAHHPRAGLDHRLRDRQRLRVVAAVAEHVRQIAQFAQRGRMRGAEAPGLDRRQFALHRHRAGLVAGHDAHDRQVVLGTERIGMVLAQGGGADRHHRFQQLAPCFRLAHPPQQRRQAVGDFGGSRIPFAAQADRIGAQRLQQRARARAIAQRGNGVGLVQPQLDPQRIIGWQRRGIAQCGLRQRQPLLRAGSLQQRPDLRLARLEGLWRGGAQRAGAVVGHLREPRRGFRRQPQCHAHPRHRLAQVGGQRRILGEIAADGALGIGQDAGVDHRARKIGRAGLRKSAFERGRVATRLPRDLATQVAADVDAHRLDVDAFQHRLLERRHPLQLRIALLRDGALGARLQQAVDRQRQPSDQRQRDQRCGQDAGAVALRELAPDISAAVRRRLQRLTIEEALQVLGQRGGGRVAFAALEAHRLGHHPVQLVAQHPAHPRQRLPPRLRDAPGVGRGKRGQLRRRQPQRVRAAGRGFAVGIRPLPGEQLAQHHPQRVDVAAGIHQRLVAASLLRAHVVGRARDLAARPRRGGGGDAEVDDLRQRPAVNLVHQQVAGLEVAVDHALLVRVLHALAHAHEQRDALAQRQRVLVAVSGDGAAGDELHREVRMAIGSGAGVVDLGDGRVPHARQQLALDLEIGHPARVQLLPAQQLERDRAPHRFELLRAIDIAHAAAAEERLDAVVAQLRTRRQRFARRGRGRGCARRQQLGTVRIVLCVLRHRCSPCAHSSRGGAPPTRGVTLHGPASAAPP